MTGILVITIVFAFVLIVVKMGLDHEKDKKRLAQPSSAENSLKVSELKKLIAEAIDETNTKLSDRLSALEGKLDRFESTHLLSAANESKDTETD